MARSGLSGTAGLVEGPAIALLRRVRSCLPMDRTYQKNPPPKGLPWRLKTLGTGVTHVAATVGATAAQDEMEKLKVKMNSTSKACGNLDPPPLGTEAPIGKASLGAVLSGIGKTGPLVMLGCAMTAQTMKDILESETVPRLVKSAAYVPCGRLPVGERGWNGRRETGRGTENELENGNENGIAGHRAVVKSNEGFATIAVLLTDMIVNIKASSLFCAQFINNLI